MAWGPGSPVFLNDDVTNLIGIAYRRSQEQTSEISVRVGFVSLPRILNHYFAPIKDAEDAADLSDNLLTAPPERLFGVDVLAPHIGVKRGLEPL